VLTMLLWIGKRPPTDFELLAAIYKLHRDDYRSLAAIRAEAGHTTAEPSATYVPIDIPKVAVELGTEANSVFGRLYFDLDRRYGEEREFGKTRKAFYSPVLGDRRHCINFPHLEAVVAALWLERRRNLWTIGTALLALAIALASLIYTVAC
jgi:hypothetical protein